jgi:hypothetical protein
MLPIFHSSSFFLENPMFLRIQTASPPSNPSSQGDIFCALAAGASLVLAPRVQLLQCLSEVGKGIGFNQQLWGV